MVIENKSLEVPAFHLMTIKEPRGCFPFIKGGDVPGEVIRFFISSWGAYKVPLKQLIKWSFTPTLEQACQTPPEITLSFFPVCPEEGSVQFNPERNKSQPSFKIKILLENN